MGEGHGIHTKKGTCAASRGGLDSCTAPVLAHACSVERNAFCQSARPTQPECLNVLRAEHCWLRMVCSGLPLPCAFCGLLAAGCMCERCAHLPSWAGVLPAPLLLARQRAPCAALRPKGGCWGLAACTCGGPPTRACMFVALFDLQVHQQAKTSLIVCTYPYPEQACATPWDVTVHDDAHA